MYKDPKVLLIDDEQEILEIYEFALEKIGPTLVLGADGQEGIDKAKESKFNLIITDLNMPRINGEQFISEVRKSQLNEKTPILVVSGYLDPEVKARLDQFEDVTYMSKPFESLNILTETIAKLVTNPS